MSRTTTHPIPFAHDRHCQSGLSTSIAPRRGRRGGLVVAGLILLATIAPARGQVAVDRVGPPSWWVEPREQKLMLLLDGSGLDGAKVRFVDGPVRVDRVEVIPGGRAVFVDVSIPANVTPRASCRLEVVAGGKTVERRWDLVTKPTRTAAPVTNDDVMYLIMPDRFADGDAGNNEPDTIGAPMYDRKRTHAYHGGDFAGLKGKLPFLRDLGVTALWLTPVYRQAPRWYGRGGPNRPQYADFHGYSVVDFYDTNPHFGTPGEYKALVDEAHKLGLKVIQDQLMGFTGPQHPWVTHPPTLDWFNGPMDHPPRCNFDFGSATNPHALDADRRNLTDGWFAGILPDIDLRQPRPRAYAIQQSLWWATLFEADGIRLDTYPMVVRDYWPEWSRRMKETRPGLLAVGEAWAGNLADVAFFQGGRTGWDGVDPGVESVFDFPLMGAIHKVFAGQGPASDLAKILAQDHIYPRPDLLTTMLDNHDTARLAGVAGVTPTRLRLAMAFLLTTRGTPQLTWGDEVGLVGSMDDRRDYPGGFPGDPRDAFDPNARTSDERATFAACRDLLRLRRETPALRRGKLTILRADAATYVALREHDGRRAIVALNLGDKPATLDLPPVPGGALAPLYGPARWAETPKGSHLDLPAESATIFATPNP